MAAMMDSSSPNLNLRLLQSQMKCDPEGYTSEMTLIYNQFKSSINLFNQLSSMNFTSLTGVGTDSSVSRNLSDLVSFLSHVTHLYPQLLHSYPKELTQFLQSSARNLPFSLRIKATKALILLVNKKVVDIADTLVLFMELQTFGGEVKDLAYSHVIQTIRKQQQQNKNNKDLQNVLFGMLKSEDETVAKSALNTLSELHRRRVWSDDRTAAAICMACLHPSPRISTAAMSVLLNIEKTDKDNDSDDDDSGSGENHVPSQIILSKEAVYKASHKGTTSSKKKKKAKLERVARSIKKQQRLSSEGTSSTFYSPLNHLKDAQGFAEKLFSRMRTCKGCLKTRVLMFRVIARTISLHQLVLPGFYESMIKCTKPNEKFVTELLAAVVQACHDVVPPSEVEELFKHVLKYFVDINCRHEVLSVGLNFVREICLRIPLLMTDDLLQELVLYRKSQDKAVSSAARSLVTLFREVWPDLLKKKDRGRPAAGDVRPKSFGEVNVPSNIPGLELLELSEDDYDYSEDCDDEIGGDSDLDQGVFAGDAEVSDEDDYIECDTVNNNAGHISYQNENKDDVQIKLIEESSILDDDVTGFVNDQNDNMDDDGFIGEKEPIEEASVNVTTGDSGNTNEKKRKLVDFEGDRVYNVANKSLRALKKLATGNESSHHDNDDLILSDQDLDILKQLQAKEADRMVLIKNGFSSKRFDAAKLEANIKMKLSKQQKLLLIRAGREQGGKYQAATALKQKKTGGLSNRQKENRKAMPLSARRCKISKTHREKKKLQNQSGKQFCGRKAWKS